MPPLTWRVLISWKGLIAPTIMGMVTRPRITVAMRADMILAASTAATMVVSMVVAGIIEPSCLRAPSVCLTHLE